LANWSEAEIAALQQIARAAGACILKHRAGGTTAESKADGSPVTAADRAAQEIILEGLEKLTPGVPVVAEEKDNPASLAAGGTYWLVDPLDGTRDYVKGRDEFTVNIGLVVDGEPYVGVLFAPALDDMFYGDPRGATRVTVHGTMALRQPGLLNTVSGMRLITSRREAEHLPLKQWLESGQIRAWRLCSSAYKFGLLAAGEHDIFVRTGVTYEWDTAAGDAILRAVGGKTVTPNGQPLAYSKPSFKNGNLIAYNKGVANTLFALELGQRLQALSFLSPSEAPFSK
jgi:3'(2'), 5'-bisphosphate nucleotidase